MPKKIGASTPKVNGLEARDGLPAQARHLMQDRAHDEGAEHGMDANLLGERGTKKRHHDDHDQIRVVGLEPLGGDAHHHPQHRQEDEGSAHDEGDQIDDREAEAGEVDHPARGGARDEGEHQPADRVVDDAGREDDQADVPLGESRSIKILAMTGIAEIDMAVARKRLKRIRWLGSVRYAAGVT